MNTLTKYLSIVLTAIVLALIIYCLSLRNDRDNALHKVDNLNGQLETTIKSNATLKSSITALKDEVKENREYIERLEKQKAITTKLAMEELEKFKNAKRTNQTVNDWANTKLPKELY